MTFRISIPEHIIEQFHLDQSAFLATFEYLDYSWSMDTLRFEVEHDVHKTVYPFIPVGTWSPHTEIFQWAWAIEPFPEAARHAASKIRETTKTAELSILKTDSFDCPHMELDDLLALVHHHLKSTIIFKEKNMEPWLFMALLPPENRQKKHGE